MNRWRCLALLAGLVFLAATPPAAWGQNGETLDPVLLGQWLGLDVNDPTVANGDTDGDGLPVWLELSGGRDGVPTSPLVWDTDGDGRGDAEGLSRAYVPFTSACKFGDTLWYFFPAFLESVGVSTNGEWTASGWHISRETPENEGAAEFDLDRAALGTNQDLRLTLLFTDHPGSLRVDLLGADGAPVRVGETELRDVVGNLEEGTGDLIELELGFALGSFPDVRAIRIRREHGDMTLREVSLYPAAADTTAANNTSTAGQGGGTTAQGVAASSIASPSNHTAASENAGQTEPAAADQPDLRVTVGGPSVSVPAGYVIARQAVSGGGKRQSGGAFLLEDTIGQSTPIGWLSGGAFTLHAGYQQTEETPPSCELPEILVLSAVGNPFNPAWGEETTISFALTKGPSVVTVTASQGLTTYTLLNDPLGAGLYTVAWDGRDTAGNALNGDWIVTVTATCEANTTSGATTVTLRGGMPIFTGLSDANAPVCPAAGSETPIRFTIQRPGNANTDVTLTMTDAAGVVVRTWNLDDVPPNAQQTVLWDGNNNGGAAVADGLYVYTLTERAPGNSTPATPVYGAIVKDCAGRQTTTVGPVSVLHPATVTVTITLVTGPERTAAMHALEAAGEVLEGDIYAITTSGPLPSPAILTMQYDAAIQGQIDGKLVLVKYVTGTGWESATDLQVVDYTRQQVIAQVTSFSFYALVTRIETSPAPLAVRIEPETLRVNDGVLTAHVGMPGGYAATNVTAVTCEGAGAESWTVNDDGQGFVAQFRRTAVEAALAARGETLDTSFAVECEWTSGAATVTLSGTDTIARVE